MSYSIIFHQEVARDILQLSGTLKGRIKTAIMERLLTEPTLYGKPLRATLKGYWKLRVGDYRVVFCITENEVFVYAVCHRKDVYDHIHKRLPT